MLEPSTGTLEPKSKCTITATFKPTSAVVYETVAEVHYGSDNLTCKKMLKLEGIGECSSLKETKLYYFHVRWKELDICTFLLHLIGLVLKCVSYNMHFKSRNSYHTFLFFKIFTMTVQYSLCSRLMLTVLHYEIIVYSKTKA